jgi:hypothetical protein
MTTEYSAKSYRSKAWIGFYFLELPRASIWLIELSWRKGPCLQAWRGAPPTSLSMARGRLLIPMKLGSDQRDLLAGWGPHQGAKGEAVHWTKTLEPPINGGQARGARSWPKSPHRPLFFLWPFKSERLHYTT